MVPLLLLVIFGTTFTMVFLFIAAGTLEWYHVIPQSSV